MEKPSVFVTYANDKYDMKEKVLSLVTLMRERGIPAKCYDVMLDEETNSNFLQIMEKGLSSDKVIVVLSEGYKKRVEEAKGGVIPEFNYIADNSYKYSSKFIFVSFSGIEDIENIRPNLFAGVYIIDLIKDGKDNFNTLFAKINDEKIWDIPETSDTTYHVPPKKPKDINDVLQTSQEETNSRSIYKKCKDKFFELPAKKKKGSILTTGNALDLFSIFYDKIYPKIDTTFLFDDDMLFFFAKCAPFYVDIGLLQQQKSFVNNSCYTITKEGELLHAALISGKYKE